MITFGSTEARSASFSQADAAHQVVRAARVSGQPLLGPPLAEGLGFDELQRCLERTGEPVGCGATARVSFDFFWEIVASRPRRTRT